MLELASWIATPMASSLLAELGARVIKIETLNGDLLRGYGPVGLKCVQGNQSIALDLKTADGRAIVHRLAERGERWCTTTGQEFRRDSGIDERRLRGQQPEADPRLRGVVRLDGADGGERPAFHVTAGGVSGGAQAQVGGGGTPGPTSAFTRGDGVLSAETLTRVQRGEPRTRRHARRVAAAVTMAFHTRANRRG